MDKEGNNLPDTQDDLFKDQESSERKQEAKAPTQGVNTKDDAAAQETDEASVQAPDDAVTQATVALMGLSTSQEPDTAAVTGTILQDPQAAVPSSQVSPKSNDDNDTKKQDQLAALMQLYRTKAAETYQEPQAVAQVTQLSSQTEEEKDDKTKQFDQEVDPSKQEETAQIDTTEPVCPDSYDDLFEDLVDPQHIADDVTITPSQGPTTNAKIAQESQDVVEPQSPEVKLMKVAKQVDTPDVNPPKPSYS